MEKLKLLIKDVSALVFAFRKVHHSLIYTDVSTRMLPFGGKPVFVISADSIMIDSGSLSKFAMGSIN